MFFLDNSLKDNFLFNEAEDDNQTEDYQMEEEPANTGTAPKGGKDSEDNQTEDYQLEEEPANTGTSPKGGKDSEDNHTEDYQMEEEPAKGEEQANEEEPAKGEEQANEEEPAEEPMTEEPSDEDENIKKMILIREYKEIHSSVSKLINNLEKIFDKEKCGEDEQLMYVYYQLKSMEEKIVFTLTVQFSKMSYQDLLKLFFFFQTQLKNLIILIEKILNELNIK